MKKILFIIWSYSLGGGAESLLTMIVNHLNPQKYDISIIECCHFDVKSEPVNQNITVLEPITYDKDPEYKKKMYYIFNNPDIIREMFIHDNYDLYISFNYQTPSFLLPNYAKCISWVHTDIYDLSEEPKRKIRDAQGQAFEKADKIVAISDNTQKSILDLYPQYTNKIIKIYNGIDITSIRKKNHEIETEILAPSIIFVGRLEDRKNPMRLLEVFRKVHERNSSVHLYYIGKGTCAAQIEKSADRYQLSEYVHLLGYIQNPYPIIKQADVTCLLSHSEGFPMSLLESVALNVPFVSTNVGGAMELSNNQKCGKVINTDEEAVEAILDYIGANRDAIKLECEKSIARYDIDSYITRVEKIFDELLDAPTKKTIERKPIDRNLYIDRSYYYSFPTHIVGQGQKIILYGAGNVGVDFYVFIQQTDYCKIVAWVDKKSDGIDKRLQNVDAINSADYDMVLIAVGNADVANEIRSELIACGVDAEKIIWDEPLFS